MSSHHQSNSFSITKYILAALFGLIIIGAVGLAIIISYFGNSPAPLNNEIIANRKAKLREVNANQNEIISSYAWVDQPNGIVRIPVERAMVLTVDQLSKEISKNTEVSPSTN